MKLCGRCKISKEPKHFHRSVNTGDGLHTICKKCRIDYIWGKHCEDVTLDADRRFKNKYNTSLEEYEKILNSQGGVCAICGKGPGARRLHLDHDHTTGKIRGILCFMCNVMLSRHEKSRDILKKAIEYLDKYK